MIKEEPQLPSPLPFDEFSENSQTLEQEEANSNKPPSPAGTIKQTVTKELKELIKSYVDYTKNVDL